MRRTQKTPSLGSERPLGELPDRRIFKRDKSDLLPVLFSFLFACCFALVSHLLIGPFKVQKELRHLEVNTAFSASGCQTVTFQSSYKSAVDPCPT